MGKLKTLARTLFVTAAVLLFIGSCLAIVVTGPIVVRSKRVDLKMQISAERLRRDVEILCGEFTPRSFRSPENLDRAAAWIEGELRAAGLAVEIQEYEIGRGRYRNVIARREGSDKTVGATVIGAHYDAFDDFSGADDNASGVAALLELARTLPLEQPRKDQYLVAFSTEEPPFFATKDMGSYRLARSLKEKNVKVDLMVSLEMLGYFSDEPGSQRFPLPGLGFLYPSTANFIAVVGDLASGGPIKRTKMGMRAARGIPVHSFRAPGALPGVHWSDHYSFRRLGYSAVMVTDTAFMRYAHYHTAQDTPEKLDYERMAEVVLALHGILADPE
jgi:Zn-dependent M28 family amino/carboxypeptidase